jgi:Zn-dependent protease
MFRTAWTFGHFRGVPLRLHISLVLVLPLIALAVTSQNLPFLLSQMGIESRRLILPPIVFGSGVSVALFVAVLLHELGHAITALRLGGRVRAVTLMVLGGVTEIEHEDAEPSEELRVAAAGPLVNLVLGGLFLLLAQWVKDPVDLHVFMLVFGMTNLLLAVFNMIPAFPLDGGRVFRALLAMRMTKLRATQTAAGLGRFFALVGFLIGLLHGEIFLVLLAAFLYVGGLSEQRSMEMREALEGLTVRQAITMRVVSVEPSRPPTSVARHMLMHDARAALVRDTRGTYGVVLPENLSGTALDEVGDLVDGQPLWATLDDELTPVVREMRWNRKPAIVRDQFNTPIGVVTLNEVFRAVNLRQIADQALPRSSSAVKSRHNEV